MIGYTGNYFWTISLTYKSNNKSIDWTNVRIEEIIRCCPTHSSRSTWDTPATIHCSYISATHRAAAAVTAFLLSHPSSFINRNTNYYKLHIRLVLTKSWWSLLKCLYLLRYLVQWADQITDKNKLLLVKTVSWPITKVGNSITEYFNTSVTFIQGEAK